jgi:hypothetical protein
MQNKLYNIKTLNISIHAEAMYFIVYCMQKLYLNGLCIDDIQISKEIE